MKYAVLLLMSSMLVFAQQPAAPAPDLPDSLPELAAALPQFVRTHPKPFDFGPFSNAFDQALRRDPGSAAESIPALGRDLQDPDSDVRGCALALVYALVMESNSPNLIGPLAGQLTQLIAHDNDNIQAGALGTVIYLGASAPDSVVAAISTLLQSRPKSDRVAAAAAMNLVFMRPGNESVENVVATLLTDTAVPLQTRREVLEAMAQWVSRSAGIRLIGAIDGIATSATDKGLRDDAISAATRIGPTGVSGIHELLMQITKDPSESNNSKEIAKAALAAE